MSDRNGQSLPYTEDGEKCVLRSLILQPRLVDEIRALIGTDYFYSPSNKYLSEALLNLLDSGKAVRTNPIEFKLVASYLRDAKHPSRGTWLDEIGGKEGLQEIFTILDTAAGWRYYAEDMQKKWARREKILDCRRQEAAAFDRNHRKANGILMAAILGPTSPADYKAHHS